MIILMTLLLAAASMAFAVHQWWRGYHLIAVGFIAFALVMAGLAIEAAKNNQNWSPSNPAHGALTELSPTRFKEVWR